MIDKGLEATITGPDGQKKRINIEIVTVLTDLRDRRNQHTQETDRTSIEDPSELEEKIKGKGWGQPSDEEKKAWTSVNACLRYVNSYSGVFQDLQNEIKHLQDTVGIKEARKELDELRAKRTEVMFKADMFTRRALALIGYTAEEINQKIPLNFQHPDLQRLAEEMEGHLEAVTGEYDNLKEGFDEEVGSLQDRLRDLTSRLRRSETETGEYRAIAEREKKRADGLEKATREMNPVIVRKLPSFKYWAITATAVLAGFVAGIFYAPEKIKEIEVHGKTKIVYKDREVPIEKIVEKEIVKTEYKIIKEDLGVKVEMKGDYFFKSGSATLSEEGKKKMKELYAALEGKYLVIEAHTDSQPIRASGWKNNDDLAWERAKAVAEKLRIDGVTKGKLVILRSYGASKPIAGNDTAEGRAKNRRVVVYGLSNIDKPKEK